MNITLGYPDMYAYNMTISTSTPYSMVFTSKAYQIPDDVPKYDGGKPSRNTALINAYIDIF